LLVVEIAIEPGLIAVHDPATSLGAGGAHTFQHHLDKHRFELLGGLAGRLGRILPGLRRKPAKPRKSV
jgi:hypothetical protein